MPGFTCYSSELSIGEKIALARYLYEKHGRSLAADSKINRLLGLYGKEISRSYELMERLGVVTECAMCAIQVPGGSCCGAGIENWYDEFVLLINLLLGGKIPNERLGKKDCLFLGPTGCQLFARHHFCVNYLCLRITDLMSPAELSDLRAQSGKELFLCWELERILRIKLKS